MTVLNLTQHQASPEQRKAGVVDVESVQVPFMGFGLQPPDLRKVISRELNFGEIPDEAAILGAAEELADTAAWIVREYRTPDGDRFPTQCRVMIGGAPFLMAPLANALRNEGMTPVFAFTQRESVEKTQEDGSIQKVAVFRHLGFVKAC